MNNKKLVLAAEEPAAPAASPLARPQRSTEELLTRKLANFSVKPEVKNGKILIGAIAKTLGDSGLGSMCAPNDNIGPEDISEMESKGYDATIFSSHGVKACQPLSQFGSGQFLYCFKDAPIIGIGETVVKNDQGEDELLTGRVNAGWWRADAKSEFSFVLFTPKADDVFKVKPIFYYSDNLKTRLKTRNGESPVDPVRMQYVMDQKTKVLHDNPKIWARIFYNSVYVRYTSNFFEDMFASVFGFNEFRKPVSSISGEAGPVPVLSQDGLAGKSGIQGSSVFGTLDSADPIDTFAKQKQNEMMRLRTMTKAPNETPDYSGTIKKMETEVPNAWLSYSSAPSDDSWDPSNRWALRVHKPTGQISKAPAVSVKPPAGPPSSVSLEFGKNKKKKTITPKDLGLEAATFPDDISNQVEFGDDLRDDDYLETLNDEEREILSGIPDWKKMATGPELLASITGNPYAKDAIFNSFLLDRTCAVYSFTYRPQAADMGDQGNPGIPRTKNLGEDSLTSEDVFAITLVYKFADATNIEAETPFAKQGKANTPFTDYNFDPNSSGNPASIKIYIDRAPDAHAIAIYDMMKDYFGALGANVQTESGAKSFHEHGDASDWRKKLDSKIEKLDAEIGMLIAELNKYHVPFSSEMFARPKIERGKNKAILFQEMQAYLFKLKTYEVPKQNQDIDEDLYNYKVQNGNYAGFNIELINFVRLLKD